VAALKTGLEDEENVGEALANLHKVWSTPPISQELKTVLVDARATVTEGSSEFWVLVAALGKFVEKEGVLPLDGALPDMTASTELYLELQARTRLSLFTPGSLQWELQRWRACVHTPSRVAPPVGPPPAEHRKAAPLAHSLP